MDPRVKPGNDGLMLALMGSSPRVTASELNKYDRNIHDPITTRLLVGVAPWESMLPQ
jgi:hypothetical protein